jgi:hypothetical protein
MQRRARARAIAIPRTQAGPRLMLAALALGASLLLAIAAHAQPAQNANVWNGKDHQPTAGAGLPLSAPQQQTTDQELDKLSKKLESFKAPEGGPTQPSQLQATPGGTPKQD